MPDVRFPDLEPWYGRVGLVHTEGELAELCAAMEGAGIVLDEWPGLSREVRAKRNQLKITAAIGNRRMADGMRQRAIGSSALEENT